MSKLGIEWLVIPKFKVKFLNLVYIFYTTMALGKLRKVK